MNWCGYMPQEVLALVRMLRLIRLFRGLKLFEQVRVILDGLNSGIQSVGAIITVLLVVMFMFAILGVNSFKHNDPGRFGNVMTAMLTLWFSSPGAADPMFRNMFGCVRYSGEYGEGESLMIQTEFRTTDNAFDTGTFPRDRCIGADSNAHGLLSNLYFTVYVILNSLVILSLFVGVICTGMFVAFGAGTS